MLTTEQRQQNREAVREATAPVPCDRTGREIRVGDTIVYAVRPAGWTTPALRVARVLEIVERPRQRFNPTTWEMEDNPAQAPIVKLAVEWGGIIPSRTYIERWRESLILMGGAL